MINSYLIVWDFDGTLLPNDPYDSEQSLMRYKLYQSGTPIPIIQRALARFLIYADNREYLRKTFKNFYIRFMKGTREETLDQVAASLAEKISASDRRVLLQLKSAGYPMMVLSCGTADLSERTLKSAGIRNCFEVIEGNRFQFKNDHISGMVLRMNDPIEKVHFLQSRGIKSDSVIAVGDGYTDVPLLDWAAKSIMMDRDGKKRNRYAHKKYQCVSSISAVAELLETWNIGEV